VRSPRKWIRRRIRLFESKGLLGIADSLQDGLDEGRFVPEHRPGIAFSIALMRNAVDKETQ
jgi:hypothetical protein